MLAPVISAERNSITARAVSLSLLDYCEERNWAGWDPYDALNSRIFKSLPFLDWKLPRLALTQVLKRAPINLRRLLLISPNQNPKGLGLFLQALLKLKGAGLVPEDSRCQDLIGGIAELRSSESRDWCWGYSFPWQTRNRLVARGTANLVCTTFVAEALLDYFEAYGDGRCLEMALSAARHIAEKLYWTDGDICSFSYPFPTSRTPVHNANLLAAALLARAGEHLASFKEKALKVARYSAKRQRADGSWAYGEGATQHWIDNFHTGFNLCALQDIGKHLETEEFSAHLTRGFEFYRNNFFEPDGAPKYFHNRTFPLDVHSAAQSLITLVKLKHLHADSLTLAHKVLDWSLLHLWDSRGYFYYQELSWGKIRIPYMRWGQAWMLLALATVLENEAGAHGRQFLKARETPEQLAGTLR